MYLTHVINSNNIMTQVKIKNLDQLYSTIKSLSGTLRGAGWDSYFKGEVYFGEGYWANHQDSLLGFFSHYIGKIKSGVNNLRVVTAVKDNSSSYASYEDSIFLSSTPVAGGLLIVLEITHYKDENSGSYAGDYILSKDVNKQVFLLEVE